MMIPSSSFNSSGNGRAGDDIADKNDSSSNTTAQDVYSNYQPPQSHEYASQHPSTTTSGATGVVVQTQDLDDEEAATTVLENVQQKHIAETNRSGKSRGNTNADKLDVLANVVDAAQQKLEQQTGPSAQSTPPTTTNSDQNVVKARVSRLEAAIKARQMASSHRSHLLQDMIMEKEENVGSSINHTFANQKHKSENTKDGLMKASNMEQQHVPFTQSFDHFQDGIGRSSSKVGLFQRRHNAQQYEEGIDFNKSSRTTTLPLHHHRHHGQHGDPVADGYVQTTADGYVHQNLHYTRRSSSYEHPNYRKSHSSYSASFFPRWIRELCAMCHPIRVFRNCMDILVQSHIFWFGIPCLLCAAVCFYWLDNPRLYFLPGETTLAMWLLFFFRQTVTLGLARLTVFLVVDGLMLGTHLAVQTLGPLITLTAATGKGWPAILTTWGIWNLILIHGDTKFQLNWLYWTDIALFNLNMGGFLVNSAPYTRVLFACIFGGLAVSAKRTLFALRFGRKQVAEFRPRLKRALAEVCLLDEISTLAEQAVEQLSNDGQDSSREEQRDSARSAWDLMINPSLVQHNLTELLWVPKIEYQHSLDDLDDDGEEHRNSEVGHDPRVMDYTDMEPKNDKKAATFSEQTSLAALPELSSSSTRQDSRFKRSDIGLVKIKDMLDSWEVPDTTDDKWSDISIHEILKFRRALAHLEEDNVFGDAFGSTVTRDDCIANGHRVYYRLLKLAQDSDRSDDGRIQAGVLPFEVLALLCVGDDGTSENVIKKRKIRKLFTPDRSGELPLLAFIQAVDQCYKRLVFLRASLRNASLLDDVLEKLFNGIFYFVLFLFLSSVLHLHPWALMVSITSILVSVSFAFGSSVSAYVDGILLIAIRRPFDLGDRIFVCSADGINPCPDVTRNSWFVEDITLATTTLRYARTNEVCTVNNSSIASTRIINLARSPNATVQFEFAAHISIFEGDKLEQLRKEIEKYIDERPRVWDALSHIRHGMFDADNERVDISMALRHRSAWQEAGRIKNDRADFFRFLYAVGNKMNIHFSAPAEQQLVYQAGALRRGDNEDGDARALLARSNIRAIDPGHGVFRPPGTQK